MLFKHQDLEYSYSVTHPVGGGETNLNLKTNYSDKDVTINNFYINKDNKNGPIEVFSIYSTGLAVFIRQTSDKIEMFSNKEFQLEDDGNFHLVS